MSEPAKDETDLVKCMAKAMHDSVYKGETDWKDTRKFERYYREAEAEAALVAIRAAGWAVVPVEPTEEMRRATFDLEHWKEVCYAHEAELDWLRADVKRMREALEYAEAAAKGIASSIHTALEKERRAKAPSDLAEMDADLLDIDPEMKP
jgi:hypothetical protein